MSPATASYLDGPRLVAWLHRIGALEGYGSVQLGRRGEVRIRRWRDGGAASIGVADELLCSLGVCLGEVPDEFYRDPPADGWTRRLGAEEIERILALHDDGLTFAEIGRQVGCDGKTAKSHVLKAGLTRAAA